MDSVAARTLLAVPADMLGSDTEKFFDMVIAGYSDGYGPETLDEFVVYARDQDSLLSRAAEEFRDRLRTDGIDSSWLDSVRAWMNEANSTSALIDLWTRVQRDVVS